MDDNSVRLRPVVEDDLAMIRRFLVEPGLIGLDWNGFEIRPDRRGSSPATAFSARTAAG